MFRFQQVSLVIDRLVSILFAILLLLLFFPLIATAQVNCNGEQIFNSKSCTGDAVSSDEAALIQIVNRYRADNKRPQLLSSPSLSMVANRRLLDIRQNKRSFTHSWSNCAYDLKNETTWTCVVDAPRRLRSGYEGNGYETLFMSTSRKVVVSNALDAWKKSDLHNSILLNLGAFQSLNYDAIGVAVDWPYVALWIGSPNTAKPVAQASEVGLGVSFEQVTAGLSGMIAIDKRSSAVSDDKWRGTSADGKVKLDLAGTGQDIRSAELVIPIELEPGNELTDETRTVLLKLLRNIFPEWRDPSGWLEASAGSIRLDHTASRTTVVRKILVEMRSNGPSSLQLRISPQQKIVAVEIN